MRVGFVSVGDPRSITLWAGTPWHMIHGLESVGVDVVPLGPLSRVVGAPLKAVQYAHNRLRETNYYYDREPLLLGSYARQIKRMLSRVGSVDVLLSPGSIPFGMLDLDVPTVIWADATVGVMIDYYDHFTDMSIRTKQNAADMERSALVHASLFVGSSEWSRRAAILEYGISPSKTAVIPYGANLGGAEIPAVDRSSTFGGAEISILLVGTDWERKGVPTAMEAVRLLRTRGHVAYLDVVGAIPPRGEEIPAHVRVHGFIDKKDPTGLAKLRRLFERASLFMLPSRAECTAIVLCEAAAYGLPAVVSRTGGMSAVVEDGIHGKLVEPMNAEAFAAAAETILGDRETYLGYSREARKAFEARLNWESASAALVDAIGTATRTDSRS